MTFKSDFSPWCCRVPLIGFSLLISFWPSVFVFYFHPFPACSVSILVECHDITEHALQRLSLNGLNIH